jgi:hypothetical protein
MGNGWLNRLPPGFLETVRAAQAAQFEEIRRSAPDLQAASDHFARLVADCGAVGAAAETAARFRLESTTGISRDIALANDQTGVPRIRWTPCRSYLWAASNCLGLTPPR